MASAFCVRNACLTNQLISPVDIQYNGQSRQYKALWDTGANSSCISMDVVHDLSMISTGKIPVRTPSGTGIRDTYLLDVVLPNSVRIQDLMVCDSEIGSQGIGMLLGMDVISRGDFAVTHPNGKTMFSFRIPSTSAIDFVSGLRVQDVIGQQHGKGKRKHR